jgi:hypothetical protein
VCFTIEWGIVSNGQCQAKEYYEALDTVGRAKALALFKRMADFGKIFGLFGNALGNSLTQFCISAIMGQ